MSVEVVLVQHPFQKFRLCTLSFHIRAKEQCAPTYPLCSALSLCERLSLFSALNALSHFPVVLKTPVDSVLHLRTGRVQFATMTSAGFRAFSTALRQRSLLSQTFVQTSRVTHVSFSPFICHIYKEIRLPKLILPVAGFLYVVTFSTHHACNNYHTPFATIHNILNH